MKIKDRIKELRRVRASELMPNPKNWRKHPQAQQDALRGVLAEIGYASAVLARETPDGGLMLIDGHLRAETTPEQEVPVLVLDVSEAEADKLLATFDPLGAMAETDAAKLDELLREIETGSEGLAALLSEIAPQEAIEFSEVPESIEENVKEIEEIKSQRKKGNEGIATKNDTEKFLCVVFPSREAKEELLKSLGLPGDERYVPSSALVIKAKSVVRRATSGRPLKAAEKRNSGAGG